MNRLIAAPWGRLKLPTGSLLRVELLAGLVVALALIPEAISFSILAGVDPRVGLYASFTMAVAISFTGGRPAMISAATGAMALVVVSLVADHGVEYLLAATILAGAIQVTLGALGLVLVAAGLAIIVVMPRLTRAVPAPLVAIGALTVLVVAAGIAVPDVGDEGALPGSLPILGIPLVPISLQTLGIIAPYALTLAAVGAGVLTAALFARRVAHLVDVERVVDPDGTSVLYSVTGELFFASDQELIDAFDYAGDPSEVLIDLSRAHVWDASAVAALDAVEMHYRRHDCHVEITGLNRRSAELHDNLSGQLAGAHG